MDEDLDFELDRFQQSKWEQLKSATRLALEHRKRVREGDFSAFLMPLAFAIAKDAIFDFIPLIGNLLGFFITVFLFIFLWGKGKWKVRLVIFFLSFFDSIPFVNFLPFQTLCVAYAYYVAKKDADRSRVALESLNKATPKIADDLRGVARQRALAASRAAEETAPSSSVPAEMEKGARTLSQGRPGQSLGMAAQLPRPQVVDAQAVAGQRGSRIMSPPSQSAAAGGAPAPRMIDGTRMQLAQVRGRAANDSVYRGAQPTRQQAVSGSDIAPTSRLQSAPKTVFQKLKGLSTDAPTRIQEAGSRLSRRS